VCGKAGFCSVHNDGSHGSKSGQTDVGGKDEKEIKKKWRRVKPEQITHNQLPTPLHTNNDWGQSRFK